MSPCKQMIAYVWIAGLILGGLFASPEIGLAQQETPVQAANAPSSGAAARSDGNAGIAHTAAELPDSPGAILARLQDQSQQSSASEPPATAEPAPQTQSQPPQASQPRDQSRPSSSDRPVGTAAAEGSNVSGIAASQPAGVAIAPAKQHRTRTLVLRTGAIIGAGVAIGTVVGLTAATSSKPPGAH